MKINSYYFCGHEVSDYAKKNGYVDYATLAKAFDSVLNNVIMEATSEVGYWEQVSGFIDNSDEIEALKEQIEELEDQITADSTERQGEQTSEQIRELEEKIEGLEREQDEPTEVFQWYIVSDNGADILQEINEVVYYNETLDMYLWGVTHYGTGWDYVLTNIAIECEEV